MKILFVALLALHCLLEGLTGATMTFAPELIFPGIEGLAREGAVNQGMLSLATVATIFWLWPNRQHRTALSVGLAGLANFHSFVFVASLISGAISQAPAYGIHLLLGGLFWLLWFKRGQLAVVESHTKS